MPKNECLSGIILPHIINNAVIFDDNPVFTTEQWKEQEHAVKTYIRPNHTHPNLNGHKKIAEHIVNALKDKI